MLNSKRDESIKRYLSRIGRLEHKSRLYNSRYYVISDEIRIRFADHFSDREKRKKNSIDIDIAKVSDLYTIRVFNTGMTATLEEDKIIPYLKSIILLYPTLNETVAALKVATRKLENETSTLKIEFGTIKNEYNSLKQDKANIEQLKFENSQLRSKSKKLEDQVTKIKTKAQALFDVARNLNMVDDK